MKRGWGGAEAGARSNLWTFSLLKPGGDPAEVEAHADQAGNRHLPDQRARARVRVSAGFAFGSEHRQGDQKNGSEWRGQKMLGRGFAHGYRPARYRLYIHSTKCIRKGAVPPVPAQVEVLP